MARRVQALPRALQTHVARARQLARQLAEAHGLDPEKADLAAYAHDVARGTGPARLLTTARRLGLEVHSVEAHLPVLLHGPVGAELLRRDGLDDPEVLEAVRWHSTAQKGIGPIAKIAFLADKLDPEKGERYPYLDKLMELALEDLDAALLDFLSRELVAFVQQGKLIHPASIEARNELLLKNVKRY